ncbi:MAG: exodeoxyribonuclease VII large subunit [Eubacteriales bacterium]|nr:exodeoxyribonuclease VII large subunit [Eubacteriales bacterium]
MIQKRQRQISSVSQVNQYIKNMFEGEYVLQHIFVKGEISNCKYHSSGHIYFTLKDVTSQISCVMFAGSRKGLAFRLEEGMAVIVEGSIRVYERDGRYQLYAQHITQDGAGRLYEEYEKRKKRLLAEGLFDDNRKKKIPSYGMCIGVVTAQTGAVIQDICNVSHRRNPYVQILLYPAKVQGDGAAETVIQGIRFFAQMDEVDTIIIGRGGGSIEDLWAFNEESLVRAVAECAKPIISAVGHETDTTLTDYAADLRAPTPSAAAELAVFSMRDFEIRLREASYHMTKQMENILRLKKLRLAQYEMSLSHLSPGDQIRQQRLYLADLQDKMRLALDQKLVAAKHQLELYVEELKGLSPLYKLQGGYSYVEDTAGGNVHSVKQLEPGQKLSLVLEDGRADVQVQEIRKGELWQEN